MPVKSVYNDIADAAAVDAKIKEDTTKDKNSAPENNENSTDSQAEVPAAYDAEGVSVKEEAKSKAKKFTYKNLEGDLNLIPSKKCFRIFAGQTIHLSGVGKWLSGFYYVSSRSITISGGGALTIKLKIERMKFGDSLKGEPFVEVEEEDAMKNSTGASDPSVDSGGDYGESFYEDGTNPGNATNTSANQTDEGYVDYDLHGSSRPRPEAVD